ncbi:MAG: hypothetical protein HYV07_00835 [Deltaproteobacteria bacterium]|nr:hypothetical protein [Deltaproteobacteria bacterium]
MRCEVMPPRLLLVISLFALLACERERRGGTGNPIGGNITFGGDSGPGLDAAPTSDGGSADAAAPPRGDASVQPACATSCDGCCDEQGRCVSTSQQNDDACGSGEQACSACSGGAVCRSGVCFGAQICVPGSSLECTDFNEDFAGETCCVSGVSQCVDGTSLSCETGHTDRSWTGSKCCLEFDAICVPGDSLNCGTGSTVEEWTGSVCCVRGAIQCVESTSELDCTTGHTGRAFTGASCCFLE